MPYLYNQNLLRLWGAIYILQIVEPGKVISLAIYVYSFVLKLTNKENKTTSPFNDLRVPDELNK